MTQKLEQQLNTMNDGHHISINENDFIQGLHGRIVQSRQRRQTLLASFVMVGVLWLSTLTQIGAPIENHGQYFVDYETEYFETDFWNLNDTDLYIDTSYYEDLAVYLLEEGDLWDTLDLLNEIELDKGYTL